MVIWSLAEASDVYILAVLHFPCAAVYENPHFASTSAVSVYHVHKSITLFTTTGRITFEVAFT